jgi:hypothetical protein
MIVFSVISSVSIRHKPDLFPEFLRIIPFPQVKRQKKLAEISGKRCLFLADSILQDI